jgi:hypothetical protein
MKQLTHWWESRFFYDEIYGDIRLKKLDGGKYVPYKISSIKVENVSLEMFLELEDGRLPLIIGTQFGFFPRLNTIPGFYLEPRLVALLSKSVLSGSVAGLSICLIPGREESWKIIRDFPNKHEDFYSSTSEDIDPQKDFGCVMNSGERLVLK